MKVLKHVEQLFAAWPISYWAITLSLERMKLLAGFLVQSAFAAGCDPVLADGSKIYGVELPESMIDNTVKDYNKCVYPVNLQTGWLEANLWCQQNIPTQPCGEHCKVGCLKRGF